MSKSITIAFIGSWGTPAQLLKNYKYYTPKNDGVWVDRTTTSEVTIRGTANLHEADIYVVMDTGHRRWRIGHELPRHKVVCVQREPSAVKRVKWPHNVKAIVRHVDILHIAAPWICKPYRFLKEFPYQPRTFPLVVITSGKVVLPGHRQRLALVYQLVKQLPSGMLHVYGRGLDVKQLGSCYRGEVKGRCKFNILSKYRYALAIENSVEHNYMTEKIYDCFLSLTFPLYWGAPNIATYYSDVSYVQLPTLTPTANLINLIQNRILQPVSTTERDALRAARDQTMDKYNIWSRLAQVLSK